MCSDHPKELEGDVPTLSVQEASEIVLSEIRVLEKTVKANVDFFELTQESQAYLIERGLRFGLLSYEERL